MQHADNWFGSKLERKQLFLYHFHIITFGLKDPECSVVKTQRDAESNGLDSGINMKVEALETGLF